MIGMDNAGAEMKNQIFKRIGLLIRVGAAVTLFSSAPVAFSEDVWPSPGGLSPQVQSSPFAPPAKNDVTFTVDTAPGLDTGCTFRGGGPLTFDIPVTRYVGDVQKLLASGAIKATATLRMPAFDVDFKGYPPPERDRVSINGHVVPGEWLSGDDGVWKLNAWDIPVEWINFPAPGDPKSHPALNSVRIDIDTASSRESWCTAIDWASLSIEVTRPQLLVHGILSHASTWSGIWTTGLANRGIPYEAIDLSPGGIGLDSIADNANDIANKVSELKTRWGVGKLNIVAHSKGGLDSRHFAETNDSIFRLTQVGTPNAGSPLADYIQAGSIYFFGLGNTIRINRLAGPAGYQLTTAYMAGYNYFHGHNRKTTYVSMAGVYSGGGLIDRILNTIIPGDDDTIVPKLSVHALGYASHLTYSSTGANTQAKHTGQTSSSDIFASLIGGTSTPVGAKSLENVATSGQDLFMPAAATAPAVGTVIQDETDTHTILVDGTGQGSFTLFYGEGNLDLALISPSGQRIDPTAAQLDSNVEFDADESTEGFKVETYAFVNLESGPWQVEVSGTAVPTPPGVVGYMVGAWMENSSIEMAAGLRNAASHIGESLILDATLTDAGSPLLGATVMADIKMPSGAMERITLHDDGLGPDQIADDGIYSGASSPTVVAGIHNISVTATGASPGFSRQAFVLASVAAGASALTGNFLDTGVDSNGNGLFELLAIDVELDVDKQAAYIVVAELRSPSGALISSETVRANLTPGIQNLRLAFEGETIFSNGEDGPYTLSSVRLGEETAAGDVLKLDELTNPYVTAAYRFNDFEHSSIQFLGTGSENPVDTNGNGLYDELDVFLDVDVRFSGSYQWTARLLDRNDVEIEFVSGAGTLNSGGGSIALRFDGRKIGANGVNGPYRVTDLLILGAGQSSSVTSAYETRAYLANEFEGFVGVLEGDFNADGCIDRSDLSILLNAIRSGQGTVTEHDLNDDNAVNISDARKLVTLFSNPRGAACTP